MGWGGRGWRGVRGHSASGARPHRSEPQWEKCVLRVRPVPDLQGAAPEGGHLGAAGDSSPGPRLPGAGLQQDLPLHLQNLHQLLQAHRAALSQVLSNVAVCFCPLSLLQREFNILANACDHFLMKGRWEDWQHITCKVISVQCSPTSTLFGWPVQEDWHPPKRTKLELKAKQNKKSSLA